jgi:hypothetical protein
MERKPSAEWAIALSRSRGLPETTMSEHPSFFKALAPVLVANKLTVVFVYSFAEICQKERSGQEEGRLAYMWLILPVLLMMLYGPISGASVPLKSSTEDASVQGLDS